MAIKNRAGRKDEEGLSEVIGFVLILGILSVVFSLYLAYGVPAQGRENEIQHMTVVKDQFVEYKIGLDSLFTNNKVGTTLSNSFTPGTGGAYTQGVMSFIPVMSPVNSGGTFTINRRTTTPETLNISSQSLIVNDTLRTSVDLKSTPTGFNFTPSHVYINISNIQSTDLKPTGFFGAKVSGAGWVATINLTPHVAFYITYKSILDPGCGGADYCPSVPNANRNGTAISIMDPNYCPVCLVPLSQYNYTGTDLTLSITKGSVITMMNHPMYTTVAPNTVYTIDLMDDSYGLKPLIRPADNGKPQETITLITDLPLNAISATGNITYNFAEINPYVVTPITLGSIAYHAQNNYYISQDYYYQMGGVFLTQTDGNTTYKLPPEISISYDPSLKITSVNISALAITDPFGSSSVGGNSPVQIKTTLDRIYPLPYAVGRANSRWIRIGVNTSDNQARVMWKNYFNYTAKVAGIPESSYQTGTTGTESYIRINSPSGITSGDYYDVNVIASNATYTARLYGVGG